MYRSLIVPETFRNVLKVVTLRWVIDYGLGSFLRHEKISMET